MRFYSTRNKHVSISFEEAVRQGMAPDGGLFMPGRIERLPEKFWREFPSLSFHEVALSVATHFLGDALTRDELNLILHQSLTFDAPLVKIEEDIYSLELFHGPTLAFKDFGARFLAAVLAHFAIKSKQDITILVATSGDTGSAVAHGFFGVPGVRVIVVYPSGKVSELQEKQFATLGGNVVALEVAGTFDDCQRMVKEAFADVAVRQQCNLTSANSINIARLIAQMFYYFRAYQQLPPSSYPVVVSVPSGNFGNLTAGLMAKRMGLPIHHFIASTNVNDVVPEYLKTGLFSARASMSTISNAMDVGNPSNFARILDLFDHNHAAIQEEISGYSFTDDETSGAMADVYHRTGYAMDPHGAVGYLGLQRYRAEGMPFTGIFLETAHPGKFSSVVGESIHQTLVLPPQLLELKDKQKKSIRIGNDIDELKTYLKSM